jgi:hypothetical protein
VRVLRYTHPTGWAFEESSSAATNHSPSDVQHATSLADKLADPR